MTALVIGGGIPMASRLILIVIMLGIASGCGNRVDPVVADMARDFRRLPPAPGLRLVAARGEGRTLILQFEIPPETAQVLDAPGVAHMFAAGICSSRRDGNFFSDGRTLRIELSSAGHAATNASVDHCSGPVGQGINIDTWVEVFRPMVGRDFGDGAKMTSVRADGQTLVMVMDGRAGWRTGLDQETVARAFLEDPCGQPRGFGLFDGTRSLRIDTTEDGRNLIQGLVVRHCPAPRVARP